MAAADRDAAFGYGDFYVTVFAHRTAVLPELEEVEEPVVVLERLVRFVDFYRLDLFYFVTFVDSSAILIITLLFSL